MAGIWDSNLKRLIGDDPQAFLDWLLPGTTFIREVPTHLNRGIDIDILYEIKLDGEPVLFHLEFQRSKQANMAKRVLEYNVFATCKYDSAVISFVIYLKEESNIAESPLISTLRGGRRIWQFDFTNIKLWEVPTDEMR